MGGIACCAGIRGTPVLEAHAVERADERSPQNDTDLRRNLLVALKPVRQIARTRVRAREVGRARPSLLGNALHVVGGARQLHHLFRPALLL